MFAPYKPPTASPGRPGRPRKPQPDTEAVRVFLCPCYTQSQVGLLLQCCECLYWSHGDCVGLEDPPGVPYFCPECHPEQHLPSLEYRNTTRFQKDAAPARSLPSVPLNVEFTGDVMDMTKDWTEDESKYQRRHVAFSHSVEGDTLKIKPLVSRRPSIFVSPPNTTLMIHCVARKTAKGHLADFCFASFDLTLLIEGLCRRYFTSEEKKQLRAQCKPFPGVYLDPTAEPGRTLCPLLTELHQSSCALTRKHFQDAVKVFPWSILPDMISYLMPLYCRVPLAARKDPLVMWDLAQKQPVSVLPERPPNRRPSRLQPAPLKHRQSTMTYGYESSDTDSIDSDGQLRKKRRRPASSSSSGRSSASSEAEVEAPDSSGIDSPIPAELVPLETFLNNQNPGLGAAAGALLREQGITAQAQFSMFRTVEWWSQFHATHLVGKGLSALDEFLLKKVIAAYLES